MRQGGEHEKKKKKKNFRGTDEWEGDCRWGTKGMVYRPSPIPEELEDFLPGFGPTPAEWPPLLMRHIVGGRPTTPEPSPLPPPTPSPLHTPCFSPLYRPSPESPQFDDYLPGFRPTPEPWPL